MTEDLLKVTDLKITYQCKPPVEAVGGVNLDLKRGQNIGLVGESGCGKTTLAKAMLGLLPKNGQITGGSIYWDGRDITQYNNDQFSSLRWRDIAMIPQSAMNSLDPVYKLIDQIIEPILTHEKVTKTEARNRAVELCKLVGIEPRRLQDYPHQLSGGMKQRMIIAMALALSPRLIIADEPTTALDVIVQDRILEKIIELQTKLKFAMIYISHDIAVISETCETIVVMYAGKLVEYGKISKVIKNPSHPYTMGLKNAFPDIRRPHSLISIPGFPPALCPPPPGCRFAPRCPFASGVCKEEEPQIMQVGGEQAEQYVACHFGDRADNFREQSKNMETWRRSVLKIPNK